MMGICCNFDHHKKLPLLDRILVVDKLERKQFDQHLAFRRVGISSNDRLRFEQILHHKYHKRSIVSLAWHVYELGKLGRQFHLEF
jgi:hypothetical protein